MSVAARISLVLAIVLAVLVGLDAAVQFLGPAEVEELPRLAEVDLGTVRRVRILRDEEQVTLERVGDTGSWKVTAPFEAPADSDAVRDLVSRLRRGVPMQVKLDDGNVEEYGLKSGKAIRLQVEVDDVEAPIVDIYVGSDTVGGASFVRFPDDTTVYRAQVGGAHRLSRAAREWRDPGILDFEAGAVSALEIRLSPENSVRLEKGQGAWSLAGEPDFDVDEVTVDEVLTRLTGMRAGRVLPADFPVNGPTVLEVLVERAGLDSVTLTFQVEGELAYVRRTGRDEVFQIALSAPRRLALPRAAWRDRQLVDVDRTEILRMTWHDPANGDYIIEQGSASSEWTSVQPPNVDLNLRDSMQGAIALASLRAEGLADVVPEAAGFPARTWIDLELRDGSTVRVELGIYVSDERKRIFVRTADQPERIGVMPARDVLRIRQAWSR